MFFFFFCFFLFARIHSYLGNTEINASKVLDGWDCLLFCRRTVDRSFNQALLMPGKAWLHSVSILNQSWPICTARANCIEWKVHLWSSFTDRPRREDVDDGDDVDYSENLPNGGLWRQMPMRVQVAEGD